MYINLVNVYFVELESTMSQEQCYESDFIRGQILKNCYLIIVPLSKNEKLETDESQPKGLKCARIILEAESGTKIQVEIDNVKNSEQSIKAAQIESVPINYPFKHYIGIPNLSLGNVLDKAKEIAKDIYSEEEFTSGLDYQAVGKIHLNFADKLIQYITQMSNEASKLNAPPDVLVDNYKYPFGMTM